MKEKLYIAGQAFHIGSVVTKEVFIALILLTNNLAESFWLNNFRNKTKKGGT